MLTANTPDFNEGQDYDLYSPEVELKDMTCVVGERPGVGGLVSDFARREDQGNITLYWLWSNTITAHEGRRVKAKIDPKFVEIITRETGRFEHYDGLLRRFGK